MSGLRFAARQHPLGLSNDFQSTLTLVCRGGATVRFPRTLVGQAFYRAEFNAALLQLTFNYFTQFAGIWKEMLRPLCKMISRFAQQIDWKVGKKAQVFLQLHFINPLIARKILSD